MASLGYKSLENPLITTKQTRPPPFYIKPTNPLQSSSSSFDFFFLPPPSCTPAGHQGSRRRRWSPPPTRLLLLPSFQTSRKLTMDSLPLRVLLPFLSPSRPSLLIFVLFLRSPSSSSMFSGELDNVRRRATLGGHFSGDSQCSRTAVGQVIWVKLW